MGDTQLVDEVQSFQHLVSVVDDSGDWQTFEFFLSEQVVQRAAQTFHYDYQGVFTVEVLFHFHYMLLVVIQYPYLFYILYTHLLFILNIILLFILIIILLFILNTILLFILIIILSILMDLDQHFCLILGTIYIPSDSLDNLSCPHYACIHLLDFITPTESAFPQFLSHLILLLQPLSFY